ncbi:hypothetical protein [Segatella copri]|uniref:hypothetical protein n=1 Tax=Segatella copri TaxID=165179 RepID=UPI001C385997|nr:hypothetical protein [Segatella copri]
MKHIKFTIDITLSPDKEFHEDAEHLRWLYNRMVREHGESVNFDYMHRFAKIFNKLKQL